MGPHGLEIGENTTVKIRNKRNFVFYPGFEFLNEHIDLCQIIRLTIKRLKILQVQLFF